MLSPQLPYRPELLTNSIRPPISRKCWVRWQECGCRMTEAMGYNGPLRSSQLHSGCGEQRHQASDLSGWGQVECQWILPPGQNHAVSRDSGQQPYTKQLGFPTLAVLAFNCASVHFFRKGPREICPIHYPTNHEKHGFCPKTAECQDWKGLGNFLIHASSFFIYSNSGSEKGSAWPRHNWMVTKLELLHRSPASQVSDGPAKLYHPDSHSLAHSITFSTGMSNNGTHSTQQSYAWGRHH